jgi:hypothetical protein
MKRALLVGINYIGTSSELRGCINDINNMVSYLQTVRAYASCIVLSDVAPRKPTRANILEAFKDLLQGVRAGDELWFHYSGHGSLQRDNNGDEESGADSCICPLDYRQAGLITDDVVRSELAALVPAGARLYMVLDHVQPRRCRSHMTQRSGLFARPATSSSATPKQRARCFASAAVRTRKPARMRTWAVRRQGRLRIPCWNPFGQILGPPTNGSTC